MADAAPNILDETQHIITAVNAFHTESARGKFSRVQHNQRNRRAYEGVQDWSHKVEGQSREFLPKTAETVDQMSAFVKRGLIQFGDWFQVKAPNLPLSESSIRKIMKAFLSRLPDGHDTKAFSTVVADGVKVALLESFMILKIHGQKVESNEYVESGDTVRIRKLKPWRLQIDLIPFEDYYPDPTGANLYEIHVVERDLHHVVKLAEQGVYNAEQVALLSGDVTKREEERRDTEKTRDEPRSPAYRHRVTIKEFWGTILNQDGSVLHDKVLCTIANDRFMIRAPQPFPFWHNESPFEKIPFIRVPFSVYHKALYDQVVPLNTALNELFNLMLDGGLASVWGVNQVRLDMLEDPTQASGGISQGMTLAIREDVPHGAKAVEQVTGGEVPRDAMSMMTLLDREFNASALTNDIKMGLLPPRQVKATEIVEAQQSSAVVLDSLIVDMERKLEKVLWKAWMTILQNADDIMVKQVGNVIPQRELLQFARMTQAERFVAFASESTFKVNGLSATLARARDFQKYMAIIQLASQSPLLLPAFLRRISPDKLMSRLFKIMNMNPEDIERDESEVPRIVEDIRIFQSIQQAVSQASNLPQQGTGEPGVQSDINAQQVDTSGL